MKLDRDEFKRMETSSCGAGLVLDMGWNGDRSSVMYGFVKQAQSSHSPPVLQGLPIKTVQGTRNTAFLTAVCPCDKSCVYFRDSLSGNSYTVPRKRCHTRGSV